MGKYLLMLTLAMLHTNAVAGPIISYDGDNFPELVGWQRSDRLFLADRYLDNGWFVQQAAVIPQAPPYLDESEDDFYRRSLAEFAGTNAFFMEWRMETDGPRSGFASVSPAVIVAGGNLAVDYHFTIADDQVRLIRDNLLPILYVDIEPGIPHTYRLELYGATSYTFLIDGEVVDSGIPEGAYPTADSRIVFGARAAIPDGVTTVRWDYVRYGSIPEPTTASILILGSLVLLRRRATP